MQIVGLRAALLGGVVFSIVCYSCGAALAGASTAVEQRILTQEGLAIALASTVLQSQLNILFSAFDTSKKCEVLPGGTGSIQLQSSHKIDKHDVEAKINVYFDRKCTLPYIAADAKVSYGGKAIEIVETADYTSPSGVALGVMNLDEKAFGSGGNINGVIGLGQFAPSNGAVSVDLGLQCDLSDLNTQKRHYVAPCEGGIAQDFPTLSRSFGSVTPLKLHLKKSGHNTFSVSFEGTKSHMATGELGALSITETSDTSLGISGHRRAYANSAQTQGFASQFSLFPPTPTGWSIADATNDAKFDTSVADDTTRNSEGTVTQISTGNVLASFSVDQSGTGSITYSDGTTEPITSWLLAD